MGIFLAAAKCKCNKKEGGEKRNNIAYDINNMGDLAEVGEGI